MAAMVRFGEYSPLNPNLLSPGKSLLGLGEYEEKRRQLMNRKKQEYREYLAQARQFGSKSSTPTKPNAATKQTNLFFSADKDSVTPDYIPDNNKPLSTLTNASTNTTPTKPVEYVKLSNILSDSRANSYTQNYSPNFNGNVPLLLTNASTNTTPEKVTRDVQTEPEWNLGTVSLHLTERNQTVASPEENIWPNVQSRGAVNAKQHIVANEPLKFLSPRERKLADLQESGLRSPGLDSSETTSHDGVSPRIIKTQREAYKEELRKQIEEKQRLDLKLREKEKLEEEAIARRVLQQQERMRQEFLREEAERKERQVQRCSQMEEFRRRQEEMKKAERARYLRSGGKVPPEEQTVCGSGSSPREEALSVIGNPPPETALPPQKQDRRQAEASLREPWGAPSAEAGSTQNKGKKIDLDDSLPIPVFRARSPVIPALRKTVEMTQERASASSKEMQMLEAKWQVPAVQKTNVAPSMGFLGDGSKGCPKTILTQLGAFRRQLQIEQMRMEEIVQQRNQPNLI